MNIADETHFEILHSAPYLGVMSIFHQDWWFHLWNNIFKIVYQHKFVTFPEPNKHRFEQHVQLTVKFKLLGIELEPQDLVIYMEGPYITFIKINGSILGKFNIRVL